MPVRFRIENKKSDSHLHLSDPRDQFLIRSQEIVGDIPHDYPRPSLSALEAIEELSTLWHQVEQSIDQRIDQTVGHSEEKDHRLQSGRRFLGHLGKDQDNHHHIVGSPAADES